MPSVEKFRKNSDGTHWTRIHWYLEGVRQQPLTIRAETPGELEKSVRAECGRLEHAIHVQKTMQGGDKLAVGCTMNGTDLAREWLRLYVAVELTGNTPENYAVDTAEYFIPFWGDLVIGEIGHAEGMEWRAWLLDKVRETGRSRLGDYDHAGYERVNRLLTMGRSAFTFAVDMSWITLDQHPLRKVKHLDYIPPELTHNFLFEPALVEAIRLVIARLKPDHDGDETLKLQSRLQVSCLTYLALRQQDAYGAEWWQALKDDGTPRDYFIVPRRTSGSARKSLAAEREAPVPEQVKEEFLALYQAQGRPPLRGSLIFPNQDGSMYLRQNWQRDFWRPVLALVRRLRVETVTVGLRDETGASIVDGDGRLATEELPRFYDIPAGEGLGPHMGRRCGVHMWGRAGFTEAEVLEAIGHNQREKKTLIRFYSKGKKQARGDKFFVPLEEQIEAVQAVYSSPEALAEADRLIAEMRAEIAAERKTARRMRKMSKDGNRQEVLGDEDRGRRGIA